MHDIRAGELSSATKMGSLLLGNALMTSGKRRRATFILLKQPLPHLEEADLVFPGHIWLEVAYLDVITKQEVVVTALADANT